MSKIIKKKQLLIMFMTMLIMILVSNTFAATSILSYKPKYGILTANLVLRSKPVATSSTNVKTISKGSSVKMVGELDNFYIVQLQDNTVGFMSKSYITSSTIAPKGASTYTSFTPYTAYVSSTSSINVRRGPATTFAKVTSLTSNTNVTVIGQIQDFYLVILKDNTIGMIKSSLLAKSSTNSSNNSSNNSGISNDNGNTITSSSGSLDSLASEVTDLINSARVKKGLKKYIVNSRLSEASSLKASDMVKNKYFSNTSPSYGSPFKMLQNLGITYSSAGENIAGNDSISLAVNSWINSSTHSKNIFSSNFTNIGVNVTKSDTYGYIIVAIFTNPI